MRISYGGKYKSQLSSEPHGSSVFPKCYSVCRVRYCRVFFSDFICVTKGILRMISSSHSLYCVLSTIVLNDFDKEFNQCYCGPQKPLNNIQKEIINQLFMLHLKNGSPSEEDLEQITPFSLGSSEEDREKRFLHITEAHILITQCNVDFAMKLPGFDTISVQDQINLLKACWSELFLLNSARKYDIKTDSIFLINEQPYKRENYRSVGMGDITDSIFNFCRTMCNLEIDDIEYALLTAILIFTERPCLSDQKKVKEIQEFYMETLESYISIKRPSNINYFAKLLHMLSQVYIVGSLHSQWSTSFSFQGKKFSSVFEKYLNKR